ncbi:hypothetical protein L2E82_10813 [Cichorium intybus]|uniref:Uncharacterized protein n=1 Tax=Cichorium intybus TaxID=13427 RepID=A0ACB9GDK9_CICIN|nr:hypothetical protein L2E82_10813 [Cichorium intybus]
MPQPITSSTSLAPLLNKLSVSVMLQFVRVLCKDQQACYFRTIVNFGDFNLTLTRNSKSNLKVPLIRIIGFSAAPSNCRAVHTVPKANPKMDVIKSFNDTEGPQWKYPLFGNLNDPETLRRRCVITETLVEKNFDLAFQVIYELYLSGSNYISTFHYFYYYAEKLILLFKI